MWSKLTIIAVVIMLASGVFYYQNNDALEKEVLKRTERTEQLARTNAHIDEETGLLNTALAKTEELKAECAALEQKHAELVEANSKASSDIATKTSELEEMTKKLQEIEERSKGMANVAELAALIERTEQENVKLTEDLAAATAKRDALIARTEQINKSIDGLTNLEREQRDRISPAGLKTSIRSSYDDWGFVVIGGGADQGIVLGSKLAVLRNGEKLAEVLVNNVEAGKSSADIIPSSKSPNVKLQPGDLVVSVRPASN